MAVSIVRTNEERLASAEVLLALQDAMRTHGQAVLLVPSFTQALDVQRTLAQIPGLALGVTTTTPSAWLRERWEVWGDGRTLADNVVYWVLAREVLIDEAARRHGADWLSPGVVRVMATLADRALPWLPLDDDGGVRKEACAAAGLTDAEAQLVGLAGQLANRLRAHGYVGTAEASVLVDRSMTKANVPIPPMVACGFSSMPRHERELLRASSARTQVTFVAAVGEGPAFDMVRRLVSQLGEMPQASAPQNNAKTHVLRTAELAELRDALFCGGRVTTRQDAVQLWHATGPLAEAELVAERVCRLVNEQGEEDTDSCVVVAVPDVLRAQRELVPKLVARGLTVRVQASQPLLDTAPAQAFFAFARSVARLADLSVTWPEPTQGLDGAVLELGNMDWWPPRELTDFLLSSISHVPPDRAWHLDELWRGNRLLSPMGVLEMLQSERDTSAPVARATAELLRGRVGSAASKLLAPLVRNGAPISGCEEACGALQAVLRIAGTLRMLGVSANPADKDAIALTQLVQLCEWAAGDVSLLARLEQGEERACSQVRIMSLREAKLLPPCSAYALVLCGCTAAEQPVASGEDLRQALLDLLGIEEPANPMAELREQMRAIVSVPRARLVLERALADADGGAAYPSVMLTELLETYGDEATRRLSPLPTCTLAETDLAKNRMPTGRVPKPFACDDPASAGELTGTARELVFVPQNGKDHLSGGKPVLSASQIETYLECPLKWFSLRRLRLGMVDAGHTGMEMGTFAHRVLERTHGELLARACGLSAAPLDDGALRTLGEANLTTHIPGSRVDAQTLDEARALLQAEFDLHAQHMRMVKRRRSMQQLLVPHDSFEQAQEDRLKEDLLSSLAYQTGILQGFEPRLFEWSFGRDNDLVEYAGAYITGTVDRIDVSPHGTAVIIDYKHKSPVGFAAEYDALQDGVLEGTRLPNRVQSLVYAQVVQKAFGDTLKLVGTVYLATKSPHALAGAADANLVDMVFGKVSSRRLAHVSVPPADDGGSGMRGLLDRTEELVAEQVSQMLAGNVEARPRDKRSCDFCPVMQCEKRMV